MLGAQDKDEAGEDLGSLVYVSGAPVPRGVGTVVIRMATDFSPEPEGIADGESSAEEFRTKCLAPALKEDSEGPVVISLNGLHYSLSAAFVEAAFGGLVTKDGHAPAALHERLAFSNSDALDSETRALALHYIDRATEA